MKNCKIGLVMVILMQFQFYVSIQFFSECMFIPDIYTNEWVCTKWQANSNQKPYLNTQGRGLSFIFIILLMFVSSHLSA